MRYPQTAQESAELLRQVIPHMARHGGFCTPLHYTLWYEYLAETHAELKRHMDEALQGSATLSREQCEDLFARHIQGREAEFNARLQHALEDLLGRLGTLARSAGESTGEFRRHVQEAFVLLQAPLDADGLARVITHLTEHTQSMVSETQKLQQQIDSGTAEIARLRRELGELRSDALTDPLTRLLNRRGFEQAVQTLSLEQASGLSGCTLVMLDIDRFKSVNDRYGHLCGDEVIKRVAQVIHRNVKGGDIVGRFGGEEFVVLLPNTTLGAGRAVAETIRFAVARNRLPQARAGESPESFTVSIGVASAEPGDSLSGLIESADRALYRAKQRGRNCVEG